MPVKFCLLLMVFWSTLSWGQAFSLEAALGASYCSDLTVSGDGKMIGWISMEKGIRRLFTAAAQDFAPQLRYQSSYDDGQIMGQVGFDHQNHYLYFVKGSGPNRHGEVANPASEVSYPQRLLYRVDLTTNQVDTIGSFAGYVISPDDRFLLLPAGNQLLKYDLNTKVKETLIEMRGTFSDVAFHPDGNSVIFTSNRGDHHFIGWFPFATKRIQWIAPSLHRDQYPVWSPDGRQVAFIRSPGQRKGELADITGGYPFSVMVYDFQQNQGREIWSSPADDGWFAQYYHEKPLQWAATGQLLFYSEHEGYMKIYQLDTSTGQATALIDGPCEMEHCHLSPRGDQLIFSSNCGDLDRRHLYLYDLVEDELHTITQGEFIETNPYVLEPNKFVYRRSGYNEPMRIVVNSMGAERMIYPPSLDAGYPSGLFVKPRQVIFKAADGTVIHGQLIVRNETGSQPGVLFMHGGPIRQMLLGYHYSSYYANTYVFNQYLANQGYVVLSVNYRSGTGYGRDFRRAANQGPRGASEYQDIIAAAHYLQNLPYVGSSRIGLWGGSYGGLLTAQGLARNSDIFKAGVDFHGVHDWSWRATDFSEGGFWGITPGLMDQAYQSSPVADIGDWHSPVLLIHGDDDRNVMFGQSIDLAERLKERGVHYEALVLPDEVHGFYRYESWLRSFEAAGDFFDRFLKR
jgi:dipeptidyl aminopeptidase/acylaminoacyl peptidase